MDLETSKVPILDYCNKIKKLKATDVVDLNQIIDHLNASHHLDFAHENKATEDLLCNLIELIAPGNDHILSKFSSLLYSLIDKQRISLCDVTLECILKFIIDAACSCGEWVQSDVLVVVTAITENYAPKIEKFHDQLIGKNGVLMKILVANNCEKNIQYNVFQSLNNLLKYSNETSFHNETLDLCLQRCLLVLKDKVACNHADTLSLKILISSTKCLQHIFTSKNLTVKNFGELLGTLKSFLFYGLPGQTFVSDTNLYPTLQCPDFSQRNESQSESDSAHSKLRKQKKSRRKSKKTPQKKQPQNLLAGDEQSENAVADVCNGMANVFTPSSSKFSNEIKIRSSSSDSELSDAESHISKIKSLLVSLRQHTYLALQSVVKTADKKVMFGYWSSFLPEHPALPGIVTSQTIFTTILKDPSPQVRLSAFALLAEILKGSKQFLSHADGRNVKQSFTSLSSILATMIGEIHRNLLLALLSENSATHITQILKCYSVLAENVPYNKVNNDILFKYLKHVKNYLHHKDIQVQVACLAVYCSIVNSDQTPPEIGDLIFSSDFVCVDSISNANCPADSSTALGVTSENTPWIIKLCRRNIFGEEPAPIKIQSLLLLSNTVCKYFQKSESSFNVISDVVLFCLNNSDASMQLHGAKLLDILGRCMNNVTDIQIKDTLKPLMSLLWQKVLKESLIKCLTNDDSKSIQSACCDCLSTLPSEDFDTLPPKQQILYITILLGLASDSNPNVRGAAIRCLGLCCLFQSLAQDPSFLDDVSVILIKSVTDPNVNVRFKASWSLGNLSDSLFLNRDKILLGKDISLQFFQSIGMACVQFCKDSDRVKANAVRALGNFLNYIPEEFIALDTIQEFIKESCQVLKSSLTATFMKVCWNACYALRNMFKNPCLIECGAINLEDILNCLLKVLKSPNFKVRISVTQALTALTVRSLYGKLFPVIWQQLVIALLSITTDLNFKEVQHQENLSNQICLSICHLAILLDIDDIPVIAEDTCSAREMLLTSMWKFGLHMTAEKYTTVRNAAEKLISLHNEEDSSELASTLSILLDIVNQSIIAYCGQDGL